MKVEYRYLIIATLSLFMSTEVFSQKILDIEYCPRNIRWDNFLIKGGEASQRSISVMIDSKGFVWSGNETGLYRFDGSRYVEYGVSNDEKGFAGYTVTNIAEDSEGTIWVGTSEALNKLDQKTGTFMHFFPDSSGRSEIDNFIRAIREDNDGLLWILTRKHIYSFNRQTEEFECFVTDSLSWYPLRHYYVPEEQCYTEDRYGNKWFTTFRGLYLYDEKEKSFKMVLPDSGNPEMRDVKRVMCVNTDKDGNVWIGTDGAGLLRWDYLKNTPERITPRVEKKYTDSFDSVSAILGDNDGTIWSFGNSSFSNYNPVNGSMKNYLFYYYKRTIYESPETDVLINQAFQHQNGSIWFLNKYAGLMFRFDPKAEKLSLYRVPNFIALQCVKDQTGSFWFACIRNNIWRLVSEKIPYFVIPVHNSSHVAQIHRGAFLEDYKGQTYLLTLQGIYKFKKIGESSLCIPEKFRFPDGDTIAGGGFSDSKGNLWFGNKGGKIARYNPSANTWKYFTNNISPENTEVVFVPLIREDKNGNIWAAGYNSLFRVDINNGRLENFLNYYSGSDLKDVNLLVDFLIDDQDNFWILYGESVFSISMPDKKITGYSFPGDRKIKSGYLNIRLGKDSKGNIFLLDSRSGLYRFNSQNGTFIKAGIIDVIPGSEFYDLLIDRKDRIWIAHNRGISVYDPGDKSLRTIKMPKLQFDVQSCQTSSGYLLFLNFNELYVFKEDIPLNNYVPPVYLTGLRINGKDYKSIIKDKAELSSLKKIDLSSRQNSLNFEFAALNYLNPELNRYVYFMSGFDKDTTVVSQGVFAEYRNVPPGNYKFWVTGSNNDDIWNPSGVTLEIRIRPPWYKSSVAYAAYIVLIGVLGWIYLKSREFNLIKDKKRLEAEIKVATAELEQKNLQLQEIDRIKTHFFTNISHEIRTPLSLIIGPLENLSREEIFSSRVSVMIDMMKRNTQRLVNLVNQLLDISRLDSGKMKITLKDDDIVRYLRMLVYEFLSLAESKEIKYVADLPEIGFKIWFDKDKIDKILSNLLSNAFKYTPQQGTVQCTIRIRLDDKVNKPFLIIKVADTGPGISEEHHEKIFERFYRVEGYHETEGYGTGIGLSLVHEFVTLLHGEILVESRPGEGSVFLVTIPLGKDHLSPEEYVLVTSPEKATDVSHTIANQFYNENEILKQVGEKGIRLLIIEDNRDLRSFIKEMLQNEYVILESDNGRSGLNTAFTMMPDIILTDIMMPDIDGNKLCSILKNDERTSHIPVIILTAKATMEDKITGLKSGADDYIFKPFNISELSARISNLLIIRDKLKQKFNRFHLLETDNRPIESPDDRFMIRILKIINDGIKDHSFDVVFLMEKMGMSRTHLTRKLKILTGMTPGTLIRNIRLEKAAEHLRNRKGNITEIANSVGLSNPSHFTRAFRSYFGVSPRDYLKR